MPKEFPKLDPQYKRKIVTIMMTRNCNLNCTYCYEKNKPNSQQTMDFSLAKKIITQYMTEDNGISDLEIEFFGGEPMLVFPIIKEIVEWFYTCEWKKRHIFLISTNGTILTDDIKNWLYKYRKTVIVAFSIDGTKESHDLSRSNSYDMLKMNIPFFIENWPHQSAKMTIGIDNIPFVAQSVVELEKLGLNFTANIAMENFWGDEMNKTKLLKIYETQLDKLVDFYLKNRDLKPVFPMLDAFPKYLGFPDKGKNFASGIERYCGAGHEMIAIDVDGIAYPCHRFFPITTGRKEPIPKNVNCQNVWKPETCANCKIFSSCPTCAGYNWEVNNDTGTKTTFHCEAHKLEVKACARYQSIILSQITPSKVKHMSEHEKRELKIKLDAVYEIIENGI